MNRRIHRLLSGSRDPLWFVYWVCGEGCLRIVSVCKDIQSMAVFT